MKQEMSFIAAALKVAVVKLRLFAIATHYLTHLMAVALIALALHSGYHISVPVLPTSLASFMGLFSLRAAASAIFKSAHIGRLEAEAEAAAKAADAAFQKVADQVMRMFGNLADNDIATEAAKPAKPDTEENVTPLKVA